MSKRRQQALHFAEKTSNCGKRTTTRVSKVGCTRDKPAKSFIEITRAPCACGNKEFTVDATIPHTHTLKGWNSKEKQRPELWFGLTQKARNCCLSSEKFSAYLCMKSRVPALNSFSVAVQTHKRQKSPPHSRRRNLCPTLLHILPICICSQQFRVPRQTNQSYA